MLKKALPATFFALSLSFLGLNYYKLRTLEQYITETAQAQQYTINWSQKLVLLNRLDIEIQDDKNTFIVRAKPQYFSNAADFELQRTATDAVTAGLFNDEIDVDFHKIYGTIGKRKNIMVEDLKLSGKEGSILAKELHVTLADNKDAAPTLIRFSADHLDIPDQLSVDYLLYDVEQSSAKTEHILFQMKNLAIPDTEQASKQCYTMFPQGFFLCHTEALTAVLPMDVDAHIKIDNAIIQGKPTNGHGDIKILATTPISQMNADVTISQTTESFDVHYNAEALIHNQKGYAKFINAVFPNMGFRTDVEKEFSTTTLSTNPQHFNPLHINYKRFSTYTDGIDKSSATLTFDHTKMHYLKIDDVFVGLPQDQDPNTLTKVGSAEIQHQDIIWALTQFLKTMINNDKITIENPNIEIYAESLSDNEV